MDRWSRGAGSARCLFPGQDLGEFGEDERGGRGTELARNSPSASTVYVVENRATFNAFADRPDSIVIFGGGYAVSTLAALTWLQERDILYWGDIDTHGFRILDRLRQSFPRTRSMLMDEATLLAYLDRTVTESTPVTDRLDHLTPAEQRLYQDLVEDRFGTAVRLEQERIPLG